MSSALQVPTAAFGRDSAGQPEGPLSCDSVGLVQNSFWGEGLGSPKPIFFLSFSYFGPPARNLFCTRPTESQPLRPNSPKVLRRLLGRVPGKIGVLGGVTGVVLGGTARGSALALRRSLQAVPPALLTALPPSTPIFPGSPHQQSPQQFRGIGPRGSLFGIEKRFFGGRRGLFKSVQFQRF